MAENLTASAISMVVAGNTGVTPFLTLLLVGLIERADPDLLNMDERLESLLASDVGLGVLGVATLLEFVSMCIPVVDETVDSVMTFIVPFISAVASTSTFGLFGDTDVEGNERYLESGGSLVRGPWQIFLIIVGIFLALCLHFFKMIIRLFGEFWATGCLTVVETIWTFCSIFAVIYIQPISIVVAIVLLCVSGYAVYRLVLRLQKRRDDRRAAENGDEQSPNNDGAVEMGGDSKKGGKNSETAASVELGEASSANVQPYVNSTPSAPVAVSTTSIPVAKVLP